MRQHDVDGKRYRAVLIMFVPRDMHRLEDLDLRAPHRHDLIADKDLVIMKPDGAEYAMVVKDMWEETPYTIGTLECRRLAQSRRTETVRVRIEQPRVVRDFPIHPLP